MTFLKALGILNLLVFLGLMLFSKKDRNHLFLKFILLGYPLMHIKFVPSITSFDLFSTIFFILFYRPKPSGVPLMGIFKYVVFVFTIVIFLGFFFAPVRVDKENFQELFTIFPLFIFVRVFVEESMDNPHFFKEVMGWCRTGLIFALIFLGAQMIVGLSLVLVPTLNPNVIISKGIRYPGIFSDPQQFSQYLGAFGFLCMIKTDPDKPIPTLNYLLMMLSIIAILAAGGRAGLMGWGAGFFLYLLFSEGKYKFYMLGALAVIGGVALAFQDSLSIFNRGTDLDDTYAFRAMIWGDAINIFKENPFWGIGLNNYSKYVFIHNPDQVYMTANKDIVSFDQPESGYLLFLTELGGVGFLMIALLLLLPVFNNMIRFIKTRDINYILFFSGLVCWMIGFYSTYSLGDVRIRIMVGMLIGLMLTYGREPAHEEEDDNEENLSADQLSAA